MENKMTTDLIKTEDQESTALTKDNFPKPPKHSETAYRAAARVTNAIIGESWHMDGLTVPESAALSKHEKLELDARLEQINDALAPCFSDLAARYCQALLACWPSPTRDPDESKMRALNFINIAVGKPQWALAQVCKAMREGHGLSNPAFPPSAPEFATALNKLIDPVVAEKNKLTRVIKAKAIPEHVTPEGRERVINLFADLKQHLASKSWSQAPIDDIQATHVAKDL